MTFMEEHLAWEACDDLDKDEDGMLVHRPVELTNIITIPANTLKAGETYKV